jgi:phospholipid-binding lipoprotein MlaA
MKKYTLFLLSGLLLAGCESTPQGGVDTPRRHYTSEQEQQYADKEFAVYDPAEGLNKNIYKFNAELDKYFFLPVVDAYKFITPEFARDRVTRFFENVGEVHNFTNAVLQIKLQKAGITLTRFVVNTTVGLLGTFEVADGWGLQRQPDDFGKTLGYWGAGNGAYVMLPVLGPSNVRDTVGTLVDYATLYFIIPEHVQDSTAYDIVAYGLQPINLRYNNNFRYFGSGSPFEYEIVRYVATQARTVEIEKLKKDK